MALADPTASHRSQSALTAPPLSDCFPVDTIIAESLALRRELRQYLGEHFRGLYLFSCNDPVDFLFHSAGEGCPPLGHWDYSDLAYCSWHQKATPRISIEHQAQVRDIAGVVNPEVIPQTFRFGTSGWNYDADPSAFADNFRLLQSTNQSTRLISFALPTHPNFPVHDIDPLMREVLLQKGGYDLVFSNRVGGVFEWTQLKHVVRPGGFLITESDPFGVKPGSRREKLRSSGRLMGDNCLVGGNEYGQLSNFLDAQAMLPTCDLLPLLHNPGALRYSLFWKPLKGFNAPASLR